MQLQHYNFSKDNHKLCCSGALFYLYRYWLNEVYFISTCIGMALHTAGYSPVINLRSWSVLEAPMISASHPNGCMEDISRSLENIPEKAMAPHSSTVAWKIPWMEEPCQLQSMGSRRVKHDWGTSFSLFILLHWRRKWQPTPVFLSRESQGQWSLVGCHLWGRTESDMTEVT